MHILMLSGENIELARTEAESLLNMNNTRLEGNLLYCTIASKNIKVLERLAFTKKTFDLLYTTKINNIEESLSSYPWINYYKKDFCVRIDNNNHDATYDERHFAKYIWNNIEKNIMPKVNLTDPDLFIQIFITKNRCDVSRLIHVNKEEYENRKAHFRPVLHPTAMHPRMARALVNILNPKPKSVVVDPFCGTGGIVMEAALMGIKTKGYDISENILEDAETNMKHFNVNKNNYSLAKKDSTKVKSLKNIVTDLPYGKSSKKTDDILELYKKFIRNISGDCVAVMPSFVDYKKILKENLSKKLIVKSIISHYIHKSLTRKIIIIRLK